MYVRININLAMLGLVVYTPGVVGNTLGNCVETGNRLWRRLFSRWIPACAGMTSSEREWQNVRR